MCLIQEPLHLTNRHCFKYSTLVHKNVIAVEPAKDKNGFVVVQKSKRKVVSSKPLIKVILICMMNPFITKIAEANADNTYWLFIIWLSLINLEAIEFKVFNFICSTNLNSPWSASSWSLDPATPWPSCATLSREVTARTANLQFWRRPLLSSAQRRPEQQRRESPPRKLNKPLYAKSYV